MKLILAYMMAIAILAMSFTTEQERYKKDFVRIQNAYKSFPDLSFTVTYSDHHNGAIDTSVNAKYCFKGNNFYYKMAKVEVIKNKDYIISINHQKKDIVLYLSQSKSDYMPLNLADSFFSKSAMDVRYLELNHGKSASYTLSITGNQKMFNKMELEFDKSNYLVQRMRLFIVPEKVAALYNSTSSSKESATIDYVFSNYKFGKIDDRLFNTSSYLTVSGNQFKASNQYPGYHVVSLIPVHQQSK